MKKLSLFVFFFLAACGPSAFDPAVAAQQAENQMELYSVMATGTAQAAQAPILAITSSAAAFELVQTQGAATSLASVQTQAAAGTSTALSWTPTPSPSVTPNATMTLVFNDVNNILVASQQKQERDRIVNFMKAIWLYVIGLFVLIVAAMYAIVWAKRHAYVTQKTDERGKVLPMLNVFNDVGFESDRMPNGMVIISPKYVASLPAITAERQDRTTAAALWMDMLTRAQRPKPAASRENPYLPEVRSEKWEVESSQEFQRPSWKLIEDWDGHGGLPYYTARGLRFIDLQEHPHLAVLGKTRSGKSRRFIRPLVACALASGNRVVIVGESTDYWIFADHPNATLVKVNKITEVEQAKRYAAVLRAMVEEVNRRDDVLTSLQRSTWTAAGRSGTLVILDEFGNAYNVIRHVDRASADQLMAWAESLTAKGAKDGFNVLLSNQRATGMSSVLANCAAAVFRVNADEERHKVLLGASELETGYYMARFDHPELAAGFEPSDEEIREFLNGRPVRKVEDESEWVDGVLVEGGKLEVHSQPTLETGQPATEPTTVGEWLRSLNEKEYQIVDGLIGGKSLTDVEYQVFGYSNGRTSRMVRELADRYRALCPTTTTTPKNGPNMGAAALSSS